MHTTAELTLDPTRFELAGSMSLKGLIYFVTGSTDGIGRHTATKLASCGATVIVHGRSQQRLEQTISSIKQETNNDKIDGVLADLSSFEQIRHMCEELHKRYDHIDVLLNNAGVFLPNRQVSKDGYEMVFAVNVLAPFLITRLLLDLLFKSKSARLIFVSSISQGNNVNFDDLQSTHNYSQYSSYSLSKLCNVMITYELASKLHFPVNTLDPGTVNTKMLLSGWGPCGIEISEADDEFWLATSPEGGKSTGKYYVGQRATLSAKMSYSESARKKLWRELEKMSGVTYDGFDAPEKSGREEEKSGREEKKSGREEKESKTPSLATL